MHPWINQRTHSSAYSFSLIIQISHPVQPNACLVRWKLTAETPLNCNEPTTSNVGEVGHMFTPKNGKSKSQKLRPRMAQDSIRVIVKRMEAKQ